MAGEWPIVPLGEITENFDGRRVPVKGNERKFGPFPYYGASGIVDHVDGYLFDGEYLLIGEDGENLRTRQTPIAFMATGKFWVNNHAHIVRGNHRADTRFLSYILSQTDISGYLTGSTMPKLTQGNLNRIPVINPPLAEQKSIAYILGTLDDKIELNQRMNATLEGMAQALFKSWFVDFDPVIDNALVAGNPIPDEFADRAEVRRQALADGTANRETAKLFPAAFQKTESMGWIPRGWKVKDADEIAKITIGKTPPRKEPHWFSESGINNVVWVSIRDMGTCGAFIGDSNEYLTPEAVDKFNVQLIPEGSVILSFKLTIGRVSITQTEMATNEAIAHFVNPKFDLTKEFVYCYLTGFDFPRLGSTSSIATAVNSKIIKGLPFLVPNSEPLAGFKKATQSWFESISNNITQTETLIKLRDTLLSKFISGELRVSEAEHPMEVVK